MTVIAYVLYLASALARELHDVDRLGALTGLSPRTSAVADLVERGLLVRRGASGIAATAAGRIVLDQVVLRLSSALNRA